MAQAQIDLTEMIADQRHDITDYKIWKMVINMGKVH